MIRRHIRLTFVATGESAVAELLEDEAPNVCNYIWNRLPFEDKTTHGQYSGAEIFVLIDNPEKVDPQNYAQIPLPGEIFYFYEASGNVTSGKTPVGEICIVYGRGVILRGPEGAPTYASLFARIPGDWKYDWIDFAKACRRVRQEGPQRLRIERVE